MPRYKRKPSSQPAHSGVSLSRRLRLTQFSIFQRVVETGSMAAASRELAMTQPAVSKSMRHLEEQLGGQLFTRSGRGTRLTRFGHVFARHARAMVQDLEEMADELNGARAGALGRLTIGTMLTATAVLLPEALARLRESAPDIAVSVRIGLSAQLFPILARDELDVVVGFLPSNVSALLPEGVPRARLIHVPLYSERLSVVTGPDHPLAAAQEISFAELYKMEWIVPPPDSVASWAVRAFFDREGLGMPRRIVESLSLLTNVGLLRRRPMVALMPQSIATRFAAAGLVTELPVPRLAPFSSVGYTVGARRTPRAATQRFLAILQELGDEFQQAMQEGTGPDAQLAGAELSVP